MKAIHLASFSGNIGDVLSHEGTYNLFKRYFKKKINFKKLEIRDFYKNKKKINLHLVNYINSFDFFLIGGGNYFELWVPNSYTGTSLNFNLALFKKIRVPIIFHSLGVDINQGIYKNNKKKFIDFLNAIKEKNCFLSIRNDGSSKTLKNLIKNQNIHDLKFDLLPDCGFYHESFFKNSRSINTMGINLAGDMLKKRYGNQSDIKSFLKQISKFILFFLNQNNINKIIIFPHIWKDYDIISSLLKILDEDTLRKRMIISRLEPNSFGIKNFKNDVGKCDYILGMRFHSNVIAIRNQIPSIGLVNYPQIYNLYKEIGLQKRTVFTSSNNLFVKLKAIYVKDLTNLNKIRKKYSRINLNLDKKSEKVFNNMKSWFQKKKLGQDI